MKVSNGYVWSNKYKAWRKLPRHVWLKIQRHQVLKATKSNKDTPNGRKS
ncbi:MAG: hypothetical protein WCD70_03820 [Alphaproteobacteria bacterium]